MAKYTWRPGGPRPGVTAEVFGRTLERLAGGKDFDVIRPEQIVEEARKRGSPIHNAWNWDRDDAAEQFFISEARRLCGALQIVRVRVEAGPSVSNRAFHSVRIGDKRGYVAQDRIRSDADLTKQVIERARVDLEVYINRFIGIVGFGKYVPQLQEVADQMRDDLDKIVVDATARATRTSARSRRAAAEADARE